MNEYEYVGDVSFSLRTLSHGHGTYPHDAKSESGDQELSLPVSIDIKNDAITIERSDTRYMARLFSLCRRW